MTSNSPFFSIGLTTYDRMDLLRQCVASILTQTHADFELIIGNDNPARTLTPDALGIHDPRVRIVNHPLTRGQLGNWRSLLEHASGRYFTWIADDDLYTPDFLAACHAALADNEFPACVYSSFELVSGPDPIVTAHAYAGRVTFGSGMELLWQFLLDEVQLLGNMGFFAREFLVDHTPWEAMACPGIALFREYLFVLLAARLERVAYIPGRLILYRDHPGSWGSSNTQINDYHAAGQWLVNQSAVMLEHICDQATREQLVMLVFNVALKQIIGKRKNAEFPVDVDALFNNLAGSSTVADWAPGRLAATGAAPASGRRVFLALCRQYAAAEIGRIEKEAGISRIAEEARQRTVAIDHLTAETVERQHLIEHLTRESVERLRVADERQRLIENLTQSSAHYQQLLERVNVESEKRLRVAEERQRLIEELTRESGERLRVAEERLDLIERLTIESVERLRVAEERRQLVERLNDELESRAQFIATQKSQLADIQTILSLKERTLADAIARIAEQHAEQRRTALSLEAAMARIATAKSEFQEKERVVQELAQALEAFRFAHLRRNPRAILARLTSRITAAMTPRRP